MKKMKKFRAWDTNKNEGFFSPFRHPMGLPAETVFNTPSIIVQEKVGEDEDGNEVYVGDFVKAGGLIELVQYIDGILCCFNERIDGKHDSVNIEDSENIIVHYSNYFKDYEVIGNIFENPELIEQP